MLTQRMKGIDKRGTKNASYLHPFKTMIVAIRTTVLMTTPSTAATSDAAFLFLVGFDIRFSLFSKKIMKC